MNKIESLPLSLHDQKRQKISSDWDGVKDTLKSIGGIFQAIIPDKCLVTIFS